MEFHRAAICFQLHWIILLNDGLWPKAEFGSLHIWEDNSHTESVDEPCETAGVKKRFKLQNLLNKSSLATDYGQSCNTRADLSVIGSPAGSFNLVLRGTATQQLIWRWFLWNHMSTKLQPFYNSGDILLTKPVSSSRELFWRLRTFSYLLTSGK